MADILIRGMEMPKMPDRISQGMKIPYVDVRIFADGNAVVSKAVRPYIDEYKVFPLPEGHGRLIDADATIRVASYDGTIHETTPSRLLCKQSLLDLPKTIVPAEGGGEE